MYLASSREVKMHALHKSSTLTGNNASHYILILGSFMCFSLMSCLVRMQVHTIALVALSFVRERSQAHQIDGMLNRVSEGRALD